MYAKIPWKEQAHFDLAATETVAARVTTPCRCSANHVRKWQKVWPTSQFHASPKMSPSPTTTRS